MGKTATSRKKSSRSRRQTRGRQWRHPLALLAMVGTAALVVHAVLVQGYRIPSRSMEDTLLVGDFLFVNKFLYGAKVPGLNVRLPAIRDIRRGDVVVFKNPVDKKTLPIDQLEGANVNDEDAGSKIFVT